MAPIVTTGVSSVEKNTSSRILGMETMLDGPNRRSPTIPTTPKKYTTGCPTFHNPKLNMSG